MASKQGVSLEASSCCKCAAMSQICWTNLHTQVSGLLKQLFLQQVGYAD